MRILLTTDTVGGVWRFTQELSVGLLEAGCRVTLVALGSANPEQEAWTRATESRWRGRFDFNCIDAPLEWMPANERAYGDAEPYLLDLVVKAEVDVFHASQFCFGALPVHIPRLVTAHSDVLSWARATRSEPLEETPWLFRYCRLVEAGLGAAEAVVAPTAWMLQALAENFALPPLRWVVPNGRSLATAPSGRRRWQAVTAGRLWDEAKDIALLSRVDSAVPLLVAGEPRLGDAHLSAAAGTLTLLGALPEAELLALMRESALYLCTSRYEPFGLAPLEAALCGCAILARDIPSLREVWQDAALYFTDAPALSSLLRRLQREDGLLEAVQRRCIARAQLFSRRRMTQGYLSLYRSLLSSERENAHVA